MNRVDVERAHRDLGWAAAAPEPAVPSSATPTAADSAARASAAGDLQETLDQLDSELITMFEAAPAAADPLTPDLGPPKIEDVESDNLLVELIED